MGMTLTSHIQTFQSSGEGAYNNVDGALARTEGWHCAPKLVQGRANPLGRTDVDKVVFHI